MQCPNIDAFIFDVNNGMQVIDLSRKYEVCHSIISRWRVELGLSKTISLNKIDKEQFVTDCETMSYKELEDKYKVTHSTLQGWKRKLGCFVKPRNKTHEQFVRDVMQKYGNDYVVVGEYLGSRKKVKIKHLSCGCEFMINPDVFLTVQECPQCTKELYLSRTTKCSAKFAEEVFLLVGDEYSILEEYKKSNVPILIRHNVCGNEYRVQPNGFLHGSRCPKCAVQKVASKTRKPQGIFEARIYEIYGDEFCVVGKYVNMDTKLKVKHNNCGNICEVTPRTLFHGYRCQYCQSDNVSFGESRIQEFCEKHYLSYQRGYRIPKCKNKVPLPFDFAIFESDGKLKMLIEFDGVQHYKPIEFWGGEDGLKYRKRNDGIKNTYCAEHNIPLIRISFNQCYHIDEILSKTLLRKEELNCYEQ